MGERVATPIVDPPSLADAIGYWTVQGRPPPSTESAILPTQSQQHDAASGPAALAGADRLRPCGFSLVGCVGREKAQGRT